MLSNIRRPLLAVLFSAIVGAGSFAWADHGHGGGGWSGGHGGGGWSGGHGNVSFGHFGGHSGFNNHWAGGGFNNWGRSGIHFSSGYRNYGWPYSYYRNYSYRPYSYGYFGYPYLYSYYSYPYSYGYYGYPSSYYAYPSYYYSYPSNYVIGDDDYYGDVLPPREYVVSRPVADVARLEIRLPDPQGTIWVEGKEMTSSGTVRQFKSPQLDPSQQYTYRVRAQWRDNGRLLEDERQVKVQANNLAVCDFTQPLPAAADAGTPGPPDLPPPQPRPTTP